MKDAHGIDMRREKINGLVRMIKVTEDRITDNANLIADLRESMQRDRELIEQFNAQLDKIGDTRTVAEEQEAFNQYREFARRGIYGMLTVLKRSLDACGEGA